MAFSVGTPLADKSNEAKIAAAFQGDPVSAALRGALLSPLGSRGPGQSSANTKCCLFAWLLAQAS